MGDAAGSTGAGEPRPTEFAVGSEVVLRLDAAGKLLGWRKRSEATWAPTKVLRVPGAGEPAPFPMKIKGTMIRYWCDAQGRVAAAQITR